MKSLNLDAFSFANKGFSETRMTNNIVPYDFSSRSTLFAQVYFLSDTQKCRKKRFKILRKMDPMNANIANF